MPAVSISPQPKLQFFDANGNPLAGGKLYTYAAGTTTPLASYTDSTGNISNANPVVLDARGEASVWLAASQYKLALYTASNVLVWTVDGVGGPDQATLATLAASGGSALVGFLQAGVGAVTRTAQAKMRDVVSVKDFGAVGDGVADDTAAIQAALDYCQTSGAKLIGQPGTYKISATIRILCDADLGEMLISCPGATVPVAVRIGTTTGSSSIGITNLQIVAPKVNNSSKTGLGWAGFQNSIGIELANLYCSQIVIGDVRNFGVGVRAGGYTQGCAYNNIYLGILFDNLVSLLLQRQGVNGFSNQNTYYGGQYGKTGAEGALISGAYAIFLDATTNNNTFVNPSVETEGDLYQFYFRDSSFNTIINPRFEVNDGGRVALDAPAGGGGVDSNVFINGYSFNPPNFVYAGANSVAIRNNKFVGQKYGDYLEYSGRGIAVKNVVGDGSGSPHFTGYSANKQLMGVNSSTATDYAYKFFADGMLGKRSTDAHPRISIDWYSGKIKLGDGANALAAGGFTSFPSLNWLVVDSATAFAPIPDNSTTLGTSGYRWSVVYAATGTINTSDEREKQDIARLDAAEKRVAVALKSLIKKFRFRDAVQAKGDAARIHVGVIAQEVIAAFQAENLDPMRYAIVCYDEWDATPEERDEDGKIVKPALEAGNRYGIRYDQLLSFIISAL